MPPAHVTMAANGRLVVPRDLRRDIGMAEGGSLVARAVNGQIVLEPLDLAIARVQEEVARYVPAGVSLVEELIADRCAEAGDD